MAERLSWAEAERRGRELSEKCRRLAEESFPKEKYQLKRVMSLGPYVEPAGCVVDFKRRGFEADVDCEEYCGGMHPPEGEEEEGNYESCMEDCRSSKDLAEQGSVELHLDGTVKDATVPGSCATVWGPGPGEEEKEFERKRDEIEQEFKKAGCTLDTSWIHPHEIAGGTEWEEYPAVCYFHVKAAAEGKCKIKDVLKIVEEKV
jgi:hypothetical protein